MATTYFQLSTMFVCLTPTHVFYIDSETGKKEIVHRDEISVQMMFYIQSHQKIDQWTFEKELQKTENLSDSLFKSVYQQAINREISETCV